MALTSELQALASRNPFIDRIVKQGYDVGFINAHLVIFGVPYLNASGELKYLDMISPLDLREGNLIDRPSDHKVYFAGEIPCNIDGQKIGVGTAQEVRRVSDQIVGDRMLSSKPEGMRQYDSIEEKINQYLALISSPAIHKYPDVTPRRALKKHLEAALSPLKFPDALSAREGVVELSHKLRKHKVAIIGCGGTGAYVLDYVAKTHLEEIHLFDDDIVHVHTLFRLPGAYGAKHLGMPKVEVLAEAYGHFHGGVKPHVERVDQNNIACLAGFDFVFVCVDDAPSRQMIAQACHNASVPFVDVGMGLNKGANGLYGFVRTAGGERGDFDRLNGTQHLPAQNAHDREYRNQPQIAELNALNAAIAVIRFKQHMGFFDRLTDSHAVVFDVAGMAMDTAT
ncbi:MAG: ThiF family adenylyltransferase [Candidimonas sp.]|nr:MAG: ThiF family adenylyltransferase [Candidimonas sp.]TAM21285.1 MAG: ThiF family adenylyltransferase [Candidimonas sp.]